MGTHILPPVAQSHPLSINIVVIEHLPETSYYCSNWRMFQIFCMCMWTGKQGVNTTITSLGHTKSIVCFMDWSGLKIWPGLHIDPVDQPKDKMINDLLMKSFVMATCTLESLVLALTDLNVLCALLKASLATSTNVFEDFCCVHLLFWCHTQLETLYCWGLSSHTFFSHFVSILKNKQDPWNKINFAWPTLYWKSPLYW